MTKKRNILFLSGWYPNRVLPTLGNFVQKHAEAVALHSEVIALNVCADPSCEQTYEITENTINNVFTINVYYKKVTHGIPLLSQLQKLIRTKRAWFLGLQRVYKKSASIDLVHHNILYPSGIVAWYLKKSRGIPYILTEHSTAYLPSKKTRISFTERMISKMIARNAAVITPVSGDLQKAMTGLGLEGNYEVVYNVVDTRIFSPAGNKAVERTIRFLHISTLDDAHKNISGMLRAAAELSKQHTGFECRFVGDGDTAPHIETAKQLGIYNTFAFFEGTKTTAEIAALMKNADCFLLFSNYENLPVVIIEALASGIPVISSDVGGIHEHLSAERGMLVPARDEKALEKALDQMTGELHAKKYDAGTLAAYAQEHFSYEKVSEKFHDLYNRVLLASHPDQ
jgi:glycosyltransferase involved in cell wall biosynthesis